MNLSLPLSRCYEWEFWALAIGSHTTQAGQCEVQVRYKPFFDGNGGLTIYRRGQILQPPHLACCMYWKVEAQTDWLLRTTQSPASIFPLSDFCCPTNFEGVGRSGPHFDAIEW